jgi:predicted amidohydrolase
LEWRKWLEKFQESDLKKCTKKRGEPEKPEGMLTEEEDKEKKERLDIIKKKVGILVDGKWSKYDEGESWIPQKIRYYWEKFRVRLSREWEGNVADLLCEQDDDEEKARNWETFEALITLHAIADEACSGWGIRNIGYKQDEHNQWIPDKEWKGIKSKAQKYAERLLDEDGTLATINNQRCRVLPKRHTPDVGITLRSLSANLAYHRSSVDVKWNVSPDSPRNPLIDRMNIEKDKMLSILLLPWPLKVCALDFQALDSQEDAKNIPIKMSEKYGFFCYSPEAEYKEKKEREKKEDDFEKYLEYALQTARQETKAVDIVVLPEGALTKSKRKWFESILQKFQVSFYVAGVRCNPKQNYSDKPEASRFFHDNMVYFRMGDYVFPPAFSEEEPENHEFQHKHHRWTLNKTQITTYNLGHILSPGKQWWEAIKIRRRRVTFINIGEELTICPLICEDLARQDPIADLIRTAGPSIVITILMDGPQKMDRWSAKYASVLAEDPGSAVITLTSLGMVERWRPLNRESSRVVALWNDGTGSAHEIELEKDSIGILLTLCLDPHKEPIADGRVEGNDTNTVILGGIHQIRLPNLSEKLDRLAKGITIGDTRKQ